MEQKDVIFVFILCVCVCALLRTAHKQEHVNCAMKGICLVGDVRNL